MKAFQMGSALSLNRGDNILYCGEWFKILRIRHATNFVFVDIEDRITRSTVAFSFNQVFNILGDYHASTNDGFQKGFSQERTKGIKGGKAFKASSGNRVQRKA